MLAIRLRQLIRVVVELGWWRSLIFGSGFILFYSALSIHLFSGRYILPTTITMLLSTASTHLKRPDHFFLKQAFATPYKIYLAEYLCLNLFWLLPVILGGHFVAFLSAAALIPLIPLIPVLRTGSAIRLPSLSSLIHPLLFEWRSGSKVYGVLTMIAWALGLVFAQKAMAPLVAVFLTSLFGALAFQRPGESFIMLRVSADSGPQLLRKKTYHALLQSGMLFLPQWVLFLLFHSELWYAMLTVQVAGVLLILNSLYIRYATYEPTWDNEKNLTLLFFLLFCLTVPFMVPVPLVMVFIYYKRAKNRLAEFYA